MKTYHNEKCTMAFGKYSTVGTCPRCDELRNGAKPRRWSTFYDHDNIMRRLHRMNAEAAAEIARETANEAASEAAANVPSWDEFV